MKIHRCSTIDELRSEFATIEVPMAGDTRFAAQALMFIAERLAAYEAAQVQTANAFYGAHGVAPPEAVSTGESK